MSNLNDRRVDVARLAEQAAHELLNDLPQLRDAREIDRSWAITRAMHSKDSCAAHLMEAVFHDASLGDLREGWLQHLGGGQAIQRHMLPHMLIHEAFKGQSVEALVLEARAFAKSRTSGAESYTPIAGVLMTEKTNLVKGIDVVPWIEVPDSFQKLKFSGPSANSETFWPSDFWRPPVVPTAAVRTNIAHRQILFSSLTAAGDSDLNEVTLKYEETSDVVRCLTALAASPVASLGNWTSLNNTVANRLVGWGYSWGEALFDSKLGVAPVTVNPDAVAELFHNFVQITSSEKRVLRIALDRLSQALRRNSVVDRAIDLGISLEAMLLHGIGNDRGELRFRQAIRGAAFLGGKKAERLQTLNLLKAAYDLRSVVVHTGTIAEGKKGRRPPTEILNDAVRVCAGIARKLIERGSFPDWDSDYVVNGE